MVILHFRGMQKVGHTDLMEFYFHWCWMCH